MSSFNSSVFMEPFFLARPPLPSVGGLVQPTVQMGSCLRNGEGLLTQQVGGSSSDPGLSGSEVLPCKDN